MPLFPIVQSPCPLKAAYVEQLEGDVCRRCQRQVVDLMAMTDDQRLAFMASCEAQVCVSYRLPVKEALAATLAGAALTASPLASAQEASPGPAPADPLARVIQAESFVNCDEEEVVIIGSITKPQAIEYVDTEADLKIPELPVVYEDTSS